MKTPAYGAVQAAALLLALSAVTASAGPAEGSGPPTDPSAGAGTVAAGWSWPLSPRPGVLRAFDPPARLWLSGHRGVDLRASSDGAPVTSPASGTVSFAGVVVDRMVITVDHGSGLRSSFEAVRTDLEAGDAVAQGDVLGWIQPGHCTPAPCVHWGVRRGAEYLNPLAFVTDLRPSVLLPPLDPAPG
ncbi:M23 family metallopeptidase [Arthrobacter sp. AL12]|uniref:M23 family metallopeptidase n=1 Tax=Arthrobacter sp. AL12 TaxID=3042241 RepID=UPI00249BD8D2|nr:M23 family metallopeptidase [Arthrobacter sp. AL12]MDI3212026.1 peptidoglycan DD-metalloendopeptidase family protein [Arthrobacter sp. AL12]